MDPRHMPRLHATTSIENPSGLSSLQCSISLHLLQDKFLPPASRLNNITRLGHFHGKKATRMSSTFTLANTELYMQNHH
ncbi:hypothetical protein VTN77DRAFT_8749 [Rasamsonia byssochlamydoides]|uniref:uncharacterized protein n=1 Tax=Rasamsonia byssochlamydoides TaxID=89139 RepID=UPI0037440719